MPDRPPPRESLDPQHFSLALPYVWLMDYLPETRRLRYRLAGEDVRARFDGKLIGKSLEEVVAADALPSVADYFLACPERPAVCVLLGRLYHDQQKPGFGERVLLPLLTQEGWPQGIVGVTYCEHFFHDKADARRRSSRRVVVLPLDGSPRVDREIDTE